MSLQCEGTQGPIDAAVIKLKQLGLLLLLLGVFRFEKLVTFVHWRIGHLRQS